MIGNKDISNKVISSERLLYIEVAKPLQFFIFISNVPPGYSKHIEICSMTVQNTAGAALFLP
jgi:hypothetical protein